MRILSSFSILLVVNLFTNICFAQDSKTEVDRNKVAEYFQNEQYNEAIEYLENMRPSRLKDLNSMNALGYAYFMSENYVMAQQNYGAVLALDSFNFTANRFAALIFKENQEYINQLFYNLRLVQIQPTNAALYKITGDTYRQLKNRDTALLFYSKAYTLQPANTKITSAYLEALLEKESFSTADSITNAFLAKDTLNFAIIKLGITSYINQRKMAEAAAFTKRWLLTGEEDPKTSVNLALANYHIKDYVASYYVCNVLLEHGIETESLLYYASQAKHKLNDYTKSNELLKRCLNIAISKNAGLYYFSSADNFEALSQHKSAIAAYDTAFYIFHDPLALYNIGRLYEHALKNTKQAYVYYKKYMRIAKPASKDERRVYDYVKGVLANIKK